MKEGRNKKSLFAFILVFASFLLASWTGYVVEVTYDLPCGQGGIKY